MGREGVCNMIAQESVVVKFFAVNGRFGENGLKCTNWGRKGEEAKPSIHSKTSTCSPRSRFHLHKT